MRNCLYGGATIEGETAVTAPADTSRISKTPGVIGGDACVRKTRIAVWMLVAWRRQGVTDETLLDWYPFLSQADLDAAWAYYAANSGEIELSLHQQAVDE
jgi:uncharacterized protein (DUF433 family)